MLQDLDSVSRCWPVVNHDFPVSRECTCDGFGEFHPHSDVLQVDAGTALRQKADAGEQRGA